MKKIPLSRARDCLRKRVPLLGVALILYALYPGFSVSWAAEDEDGAQTVAPSARKKEPYRQSKLTRDEQEMKADQRSLLLTVGEQKTIDLDFAPPSDAEEKGRGILVGNPDLVLARTVRMGDQYQLLLIPKKAGDTKITMRDQFGTIQLVLNTKVTGSNLLRVAEEFKELLADIEGVQIRVVGQKVVIDGEILVPADYGRLLTVITDPSYTDLVLNLATVSPLGLQIIAKKIQEDVTGFAPNVTTRVVNGIIFLEGSVDNLEQRDRTAEVALLYIPELFPGPQLEKDPTVRRLAGRSLIKNFIRVNPAPPLGKDDRKLVRITVHFVELAKDYSRLFGFKWEPGFRSEGSLSIGGSQQGGAGASGSSFSGTISSLLPKLQSAQAAGYARVLKTGTLITQSGKPATLEEQTSFPILTPGPQGQLVSSGSVPVGLSVAVTPQILSQSEDVQLELNLNQINLVGRAPAAGSAPVTATHKVTTKIYVKANESAAVAGVVSTDAGTDFNKDDPKQGEFAEGAEPLFTMHRSKNFRKKKSQFVIFVTPQIVENASDGTEEMRKNLRVKVN